MDLSDVIWRKASRSHDDGDQCIEVASVEEMMALRDSRDPDGVKILVSRSDFLHLTEAIKGL
ncbi:hypothetical protein GCM10010182_43030 [Actinomadura cremea]|nr:hypothetical protein GCM10010182_43030 [Actinomadura cremea]